MVNAKKVAIIGAGIGGPAVAMALQRAGCEPLLFEARANDADDKGAFLNLASNGLDALRSLDAHRGVIDRGFRTPRMVMWSHTGKRLGEVPNGLPLEDGTVSVTLRRTALHRALVEEARSRDIPLHTGKRLVELSESANQVTARFEDGTQVSADLLVGADGLHSRVRRAIDPQAPAPRFTGQLSVSGILPRAGFDPTPDAYNMIFGRRGFFGYSVTLGGDAWWFANLGWPEAPGRDGLTAIASPEWRARLLELFRGDAGPACAMIDATPSVAAYALYDLPRVPRWWRDRLVLIGDAIHATSPSAGQGAALAIEDALELARCLRDHAEIPDAFATYERLRRPRVERVVRYSARVGSTKVAGPLGRALRDALMPLALRAFAGSEAHGWLYRHHIDFSAPLR